MKLRGFNPIAYTGPTPADMAVVQHEARDWLHAQELEAAQQEAIAQIKASAGLAVDHPTVKEAIARVSSVKSIAELNLVLTSALSGVAIARERADDRIDPDTKEQKIERLFNEIRELAKDSEKQMQTLLPYASKEQKDLLAEAQAQLEADKKTGDKDAIAAAEAKLSGLRAQVAAEIKSKHPNNAEIIDAADKVEQNDAQIQEKFVQRAEINRAIAREKLEARADVSSLRETTTQVTEEKPKATGLFAYAEASSAESITPTLAGDMAREPSGVVKF